jgi:hypothetical protein
MDLVRDSVARAPAPPPRWTPQKLLALAAALLLSAVIFLGFDLFLTAMQKFLAIEVQEEGAPAGGPITIFAVPEDDGGAPAVVEDDDAEPWLPTLELDETAAVPPAEPVTGEEAPGRAEPPGR